MTAEHPASVHPAESVLPLVVRIERADPPARTDALEAAARAVLQMLTTREPQWQPAVAAWDDYRIRKVVRRARGAEWRRAAALPGLTVSQGSATVRVYPPIPLDGWPRELARLQVGGTELVDELTPGPPGVNVPVIRLAPGLTMSAGKAMAQAGHAAQLGWHSLTAVDQVHWQATDFALAVRTADGAQWEAAIGSGAPVVHDAGFTEVAPDSRTAAFVPPTAAWRL